jgi:PAS domain S-box-containing protein
VVGTLALVGWTRQVEVLQGVVPGQPPMPAGTAVVLVASGVALCLAVPPLAGRGRRWAASALAVLVVALGALELGASWSGGTCSILLGASLLALASRRLANATQASAVVVAAGALLTLIEYGYGVGLRHGLSAFGWMAVPAAASLMALAAGIVAARPEAGLGKLLAGDGAGSTLARRLLPATLALPALLGWLRLSGEKAGLYGAELGSALSTLALIAVLAVTVLWVAASLQDAGRRLVRAERLFRLTVESAPEAMIMANAAGNIVLTNPQAEKLFGYERQEMLGRSVDELVPSRLRPGHAALREGYLASPSSRPMGVGRDLFALRKDGTEVPVEVGLNPLETEEGRFVLAGLVDITARIQAAESLANQARELERSNAELEQFAYVASHDLQEPLRMVVSYTELLEQRHKGKLDEKTDKYIRYIVEGGKRMQGLVNDLLQYSRVGRKGDPFGPTDATAVVERVLVNLQRAIAESSAEVEYEGLPIVHGDERLLELVFQNLIANAIKFRGEAVPRVAVTATADGGHWQFSVADNGIGIEAQYADRIFQMFQRLHERNAYQGSGIGLAVTKKIVEQHGGRIWLESEPGRGSRFLFTLRAVAEGNR